MRNLSIAGAVLTVFLAGPAYPANVSLRKAPTVLNIGGGSDASKLPLSGGVLTGAVTSHALIYLDCATCTLTSLSTGTFEALVSTTLWASSGTFLTVQVGTGTFYRIDVTTLNISDMLQVLSLGVSTNAVLYPASGPLGENAILLSGAGGGPYTFFSQHINETGTGNTALFFSNSLGLLGAIIAGGGKFEMTSGNTNSGSFVSHDDGTAEVQAHQSANATIGSDAADVVISASGGSGKIILQAPGIGTGVFKTGGSNEVTTGSISCTAPSCSCNNPLNCTSISCSAPVCTVP